MLKYIFKNFDQFLESIRGRIVHLFSKKKGFGDRKINLSAADILQQEIEKQKINLKEKKELYHKIEVHKRILYLKLKLQAMSSGNLYIKRAMDIAQDEVEESAYAALNYLNRVPDTLEREERVEVKLFKALIFEILEDFESAADEYKASLKIDKSTATLVEYKEYVERYREFISWQSKNKRRLLENSYNIHNITPIEKLPEVAEHLESLAKYYARSPKSRSLGKSYYKEVLKIYKKLVKKQPKEFTCAYINALLDGVELFMMSPLFLQEAQDLLMASRDCIDMRVFLLERIKELRKRSFIKKSLESREG